MQGRSSRRGPLHTLIRLAGALTLSAILGAAAAAQSLPPLPDAIKRHGLLRVGVNCDYPPDGFMDQSGRPAGVEVDLARQIAAYAFGRADRIDLMCVSAANRIPALVGGKIDLVLATLSISDERRAIIAFSAPYAWGVSDLLVARDSTIRSLDDLAGRTVIVVKGTWQVGWFEQNLPQAKLLQFDTVSDGLQALLQGRGDGYAHDEAGLQAIAAKNARVRLLGQPYQLGYRGAGMRQGETGWIAYVDAAIAKAKAEHVISRSVRRFAEPATVDLVLDQWDLSKVPAKAR